MKILLGVLLAVTVVLCVLVTPVGGFETRAAGDTLPLGFAAIELAGAVAAALAFSTAFAARRVV